MTRIRSWLDGLRGNLFVTPAAFIVAALMLARLTVWIDDNYDLSGIPLIIKSSAAGARVLLGTAAGATITVAGIVFSVTVVSVQLASSQFSPRVLEFFLGDRFKQVAIGIVIGTFAYCLAVLAVTRGVEARRLSVTVALGLAILSILAIVAFIDRSARSMQVGQVVRHIADATLVRVRHLHPAAGEAEVLTSRDGELPSGGGFPVPARTDGWVRRVDVDGLIDSIPPGGVLRLDTAVGSFVPQELPIATVWTPEDGGDRAAIEQSVQGAVVVGRTRTLDQDVDFGIRQLVDIALRALSPGINDPTTANEVLVHLSGIVREVLVRDLPPRIIKREGRSLYFPHNLDRPTIVRAAFREIRVAASDQPAVLHTLVQVLAGLDRFLTDKDLAERGRPLRTEAQLVLAVLEESDLLDEDLEKIRQAAAALVPTEDPEAESA